MVQQRLIGRIAVAVAARFENFNRGTRQAARGTRLTSREIARLRREARQASSQLRQMGQRLRGVGAIAGGAFAGFGIAEVTRGVLAFDRELTKINTLVGVSREQLQAYRQDIIAISRETAIAPSALSEGLFNLASIGQEGSQAMESLRVIAQATAVGLGEFADVSDVVTRIMGSFASEALSAEEAVDVLFSTIRLGNDSGDQFVRVFRKVSAQAANANVNINDLGGGLAFLTAAGFRARDAGTGLGQLFFTIVRPTVAAQEALQRYNIDIEEFRRLMTGGPGSLVRGLVEINNRITEQGGAISDIFVDKESLNVANKILSDYRRALEFTARFIVETPGAGQRGFLGLSLSESFRITRSLNEIRLILESIVGDILPSFVENLDTVFQTLGAIAAFFIGGGLIRGVLGLVGALGFFGVAAGRGALAAVRLSRAQRASTREANSFLERTRRGAFEQGKFNEELDATWRRLRDLRSAREAASRQTRRSLELLRSDFSSLFPTLLSGGLGIGAFFGIGAALEDAREQIQEAFVPPVEAANRALAQAQEELADVAQRYSAARIALNQAEAIGADNTRELANRVRLLSGEYNDSIRQVRRLAGAYQTLTSTTFEAARAADAHGRGGVILPTLVEPDFDSQVDDLFRSLRRRLQDESLSLSLESGATPFQASLARSTLSFERDINERILSLRQQRIETDERLAELRTEEFDALRKSELRERSLLVRNIRSRELTERRRLELIDEEIGKLQELLNAETQGGQAARAIFLQIANIAQARADLTDAGEEEIGVQERLSDIAEEHARFSERLYNARLVGQRAGEDLLRQAQQELEIARLTASFEGRDQSLLSAEVAIKNALFSIDERRLDLQRDLQDAQAELERSRARGDQDAISAARSRIDLVVAEQEGVDDLIDYWRRYAEIQREIAELNTVNEQARQLEGLFSSISSSIEDAIVRWAVAFEDGKQVFRSFVQTVISEIIRVLVVRQILGAIFGAAGGGFNSASLLGTSDFQGFHQGGLAQRGFAVVGERGPELVDFRRPSRVYSNEDLAGAIGTRGGQSFTYAPVIQTSDAAAVRREVARAYPSFVQGVKSELSADASDRSSRFRQSFAR